MTKICSKLTIKTLDKVHGCHSGVFIVIFEQVDVALLSLM